MTPALGETPPLGTATSASLTQAMDTTLWKGTWAEGTDYQTGDYAEDDLGEITVIVRALDSHTGAEANSPHSDDASRFWVLVTGREKQRAERLKAILGTIQSTAAPGAVPITTLWRGTNAQYQAIPDKRDDTAYVTVG